MILPGMPIMLPSAGGAGGAGFTMTAEDAGNGVIGWATPGGVYGSAFGSASGNLVAGGGTVVDCWFGPLSSGPTHIVAIDGGNQSATNVDIYGTNYPLAFSEVFIGKDIYTFGPNSSVFSDGVNYDIIVT